MDRDLGLGFGYQDMGWGLKFGIENQNTGLELGIRIEYWGLRFGIKIKDREDWEIGNQDLGLRFRIFVGDYDWGLEIRNWGLGIGNQEMGFLVGDRDWGLGLSIGH